MLNDLKTELRCLADPNRAKASAWFFKTGKGEYGEGDRFLGIKVPEQRKVAKRYFHDIALQEVQTLLKSKIHEERFVALEMLVMKYETMERGTRSMEQKSVVEFYLKNTRYINNWDLVDTSAPYILGDYLVEYKRQDAMGYTKQRDVLYRLAKSKNMWERRIAMVSTMKFIDQHQFDDALKIARLLLNDEHDLIHKAVGWMLREVGKKNQKVLMKFLNKHATHMPRTTLRYTIEKFPEKKREWYLELKKL